MKRLFMSLFFGGSICAVLLIIGFTVAIIKCLLNGITINHFMSWGILFFGIKKTLPTGIILSIFYFIANPHKRRPGDR